jgi:hypothetical protein
MKHIFLYFILLFLLVPSQKEKGIVIDIELQPYVFEFISEATKRNVNGYAIVSDINNIIFMNNMPYLGYWHEDSKSVWINPNIKDSIIMRAVVFHEIGHSMDKEHTCYECIDLMSGMLYVAYKKIIFKDEEIWSKELDKFFNNK